MSLNGESIDLLWNNEIVALAVSLHFMNNFLGNLINNKIPPVIEAKFVFIACDPWQRTPNVQCIYFNGLYVLMTLSAREAKLGIDTSQENLYATKLQGLLTTLKYCTFIVMLNAKQCPFKNRSYRRKCLSTCDFIIFRISTPFSSVKGENSLYCRRADVSRP